MPIVIQPISATSNMPIKPMCAVSQLLNAKPYSPPRPEPKSSHAVLNVAPSVSEPISNTSAQMMPKR